MIEVTCAIIMDGERVLLTQRSEHMSHPLRWEFPGGKIKPGESPENCIIRELQEELVIEVRIMKELPSVEYDYGNGRIRLIPFICALESDEIVLQQHKDWQWILREDISAFDILEADIEVIATLAGIWK